LARVIAVAVVVVVAVAVAVAVAIHCCNSLISGFFEPLCEMFDSPLRESHKMPQELLLPLLQQSPEQCPPVGGAGARAGNWHCQPRWRLATGNQRQKCHCSNSKSSNTLAKLQLQQNETVIVCLLWL